MKQTNSSRVFDFDTERLLRLLLQVIDIDQDLHWTRTLTWSKPQSDGVTLPTTNLDTGNTNNIQPSVQVWDHESSFFCPLVSITPRSWKSHTILYMDLGLLLCFNPVLSILMFNCLHKLILNVITGGGGTTDHREKEVRDHNNYRLSSLFRLMGQLL